MALRVVFAEDNYLVRQGVTSLLTEVEDIDVVAVATDLASLLESVAEASPDVVLTDIRMPPTHTNEGIEAARQIRSRHPGVGVVVLSQYVEEDYVFELLANGVAGLGYLLKERVTDLDELVRALTEVARGGSVSTRGRGDTDRPPRLHPHLPRLPGTGRARSAASAP
jgi:DNA-binding NarL/FixJ family response regulator